MPSILKIENYEGSAICRRLIHFQIFSYDINRCFKELKIKDQPAELANQRLLLTHTARKVLGHGMSLLGITPLEEM